jgi:hypothetical protein
MVYFDSGFFGSVEMQHPQLAFELRADSVPELVHYIGAEGKGWFEGVELTVVDSVATLWLAQPPSGGYRAVVAETTKHVPEKVVGTSARQQRSSGLAKIFDLFTVVVSATCGWVAAHNLCAR